MTETTRKKNVVTEVAEKLPTEPPKERLTNWHTISGVKVCPDCGEPRTSDNDGTLICPIGKANCAFVRTQ